MEYLVDTKLIRTVNHFIKGKYRYILPSNSQSGIEVDGPPYCRAAGGVDTSESKYNEIRHLILPFI